MSLCNGNVTGTKTLRALYFNLKLQYYHRFLSRYVTVTLPLRYFTITITIPHRYLTVTKINVRFRIFNFLNQFITVFNDP